MTKTIFDLQEKSERNMLIQLSWPVVLSLLIQGLYSFVDSLFLSRLGAEVLSAVSLAYVVQGLASSFFTGIATGMNSIISRSLGGGDYDKAQSAVKAGFCVQFVFVILFMCFGIFGTHFYFVSTTDKSAVIEYGIQYLQPILLLIISMALQVTAERLLQATGLTRYTLYSQAAGTVTNIILDPLMIFGFGPFPALGIPGAAYATIIGQLIAAVLSLFFNRKYNTLIFSNLRKAEINKETLWKVVKIGVPTSATGICSSFGNYFINRILLSFSASANAVFGIYAKLQSIALMPTQGLHAGLVTMYSFFYGKKDICRINKSIKEGEKLAGIWSLLCFITFFFFSKQLMAPFSPTEEMLGLARYCFRIIGLTYLTSGVMSSLTAFFQASGRSYFTLIVGICRTVIVRVPVAYLLKSFNNINILWWCWPISELPSDITCLILFIICYRKFRKDILLDERMT